MARGLRKWSQTAASNANADSGINWSEGQSPSSVNDSARAEMASMAKWRDDNNGSLAGTLSTATYSVTSNQTFDALAAGDTVAFQLGSDMPATALLNVDVLGAKPLRPNAGIDFAGGEYKANQVIRASYFASNSGEWIVIGSNYNANVPIHNQTAESAASASDELLLYSTTDSANRKATVATVLTNVNNLTEDTSPDVAADFILTYDTSATSAKKVKPQNFPSNLPRGYIDGCVLSNGTDTTNDINITAGTCRDSTSAVDIVVSANTSGKQLDANWAVSGTTNSGMRNSAAGIANGTYHIYAARTAASSAATIYAFAGVAGTDPDSAGAITTMLTALQAESGGSSYIYARRLGSIVRSGAAIVQFTQVGDTFRFKTPTLDVNTTTLGTSSTNFTLGSMPLGISALVAMNLMLATASTTTVYIRNPNDTDSAASPSVAPLGSFRNSTGNTVGGEVQVFCNSSAQIAARADNSSTTLLCAPLWFVDQRGKNS